METLKFKTNLKCSGCVSAVTSNMNNLENVEKWEVDLSSSDKVLTVNGETTKEEVEKAFASAGYKAESIS